MKSKTFCARKSPLLAPLLNKEPVAREVRDLRKKPTTSMLFNAHIIKMTHTNLLLYTLINESLKPYQRSYPF